MKLPRTIIIIACILMLNSALAGAACGPESSPRLDFPKEISIPADDLSVISVSASAAVPVIVSVAMLNSSLRDINVSADGREISVRPGRQESGYHRIAVIAAGQDDCTAAGIMNIRVLNESQYAFSPDRKAAYLEEGSSARFSIGQKGGLPGAGDVTWLYDGSKVGAGLQLALPLGFNSSGIHSLVAAVRMGEGLELRHAWSLYIINVNRPPVLTHDMPAFVVLSGEKADLANLYSYFADPDGEPLSFRHAFIGRGADKAETATSETFSLSVSGDGTLAAYAQSSSQRKQEVRIYASDKAGKSAMANFSITAIPSEKNITETVGQAATGCEEETSCMNWTSCASTGIRYRSCNAGESCRNTSYTYTQFENCTYEGTCGDGLQNEGEGGVDCGGSCAPCPNCSDSIWNQGEEGVDCGGPCGPCETCGDGLRNQDETDVDCGGSCRGCTDGGYCLNDTDCMGGLCSGIYCRTASCSDGLKDQGEEGVDCGGPCTPCPSCYDHLKNQDEALPDCGGSCRPCEKKEYAMAAAKAALPYALLALILSLLLIIYRAYERDRYRFTMRLLEALPHRHRAKSDRAAAVDKALSRLKEMKRKAADKAGAAGLSSELSSAVRDLYSEAFALEDKYTRGMLSSALGRAVKNPLLRSLLMQYHDDFSEIAQGSPFFGIELSAKIDLAEERLRRLRGFL